MPKHNRVTLTAEERAQLLDPASKGQAAKGSFPACRSSAERELSIPARQCRNRRTPDLEQLRRKVIARQTERNQAKTTMIRRFTAEDARIRLPPPYPSLAA